LRQFESCRPTRIGARRDTTGLDPLRLVSITGVSLIAEEAHAPPVR